MGTVFSVKIWTPGGCCPAAARAGAAADEALAEARKIESLMSEYRSDSSVSRVNAMAGKQPVKVDDMTWEVIRLARQTGLETGGAFDITFGPLGRLWDFKADPPRIPSPDEIREALALVGLDKLVLDAGTKTVFLKTAGSRIGLGGVAKGYALDRMAAVLVRRGFENFILNGGGDVLLGGSKGGEPWTVGVQHPREQGKLFASFAANGPLAVATSGDYERSFILDGKRYHHILDTSTGMPATGCVSATVSAPGAMLADALATAFVVMGVEKTKAFLAERKGIATLLINEKLEALRLGDFPLLSMEP
jgi:thiamine biosynthesis lipoprotein